MKTDCARAGGPSRWGPSLWLPHSGRECSWLAKLHPEWHNHPWGGFAFRPPLLKGQGV